MLLLALLSLVIHCELSPVLESLSVYFMMYMLILCIFVIYTGCSRALLVRIIYILVLMTFVKLDQMSAVTQSGLLRLLSSSLSRCNKELGVVTYLFKRL